MIPALPDALDKVVSFDIIASLSISKKSELDEIVVSIFDAVATPVTTNPFSTFTALFASLPTILSTLNLPSVLPPPNVPSGLNPKTSGIKSSPSEIIKSAPSATLISAYWVYAAEADAGGSTVIVEVTGKTVLV